MKTIIAEIDNTDYIKLVYFQNKLNEKLLNFFFKKNAQ